MLLLGTDVNDVGLPLSLNAQPNWLVPPNTNSLAVLAQGTVPITMETSFFSGDPDVGGRVVRQLSGLDTQRAGARSRLLLRASRTHRSVPEQRLRRGATVNLAAVATTNPFDSTVSADTATCGRRASTRRRGTRR